MNVEFLVWLFLFLLAPIAGIWGLVSAKRRARREAAGGTRRNDAGRDDVRSGDA